MMYNCKILFKLIVTALIKFLTTEERDGIYTQTGSTAGSEIKSR